VDRALEDRGYLPRADSSGRTPDQMEALTDFDPDVSTHSPTARMLTNRHNANGAAAGSRSRELKLSPCRLFLFCPRLLGPSRIEARTHRRRCLELHGLRGRDLERFAGDQIAPHAGP